MLPFNHIEATINREGIMFAFYDFEKETSFNHCDLCGELVTESASHSNQLDLDDEADYCSDCQPTQ